MKIKSIFYLLLLASAGFQEIVRAAATQNATESSHSEVLNSIGLFKLRNPYSDAGLDIKQIPPAKSVQECDVIQRGTKTTTNKAGDVTERTRFTECLRRMSDPDPKYLKKAINEAAQAFLVGDMQEFHDIMYSWPTHNRKEIHDSAVALARKNGAVNTSTMSPDPLPPPQNEGDIVQREPHHNHELRLNDEEEDISSAPTLGNSR